MSKQEFLDHLRKKLNILDKAEIDELLEEYSGYIDNKISEGESEEKAVADFGDLDDLAREILSAYKLNEDYIHTEKKESDPLIRQIAEIIGNFTEQAVQFLTSFFEGMSAEGAAKIIVMLAICLIVLFFMRIPFWIIEHLGNAILSLVLPHFLKPLFYWAWSLVCNLGYLIFAVVMILDGVKKKGISLALPKNPSKNPKAASFAKAQQTATKDFSRRCQESIRPLMERISLPSSDSEEAPSHQYKPKTTGRISQILLILFKLMAALFLIPFFLGMIILCIAVGILIFLALDGASVWGMALTLAGLAGLLGAFIEAVWSLTKPHRKMKQCFLGSVFSALLLGFGVLTFLNDYAGYTLLPFPIDQLDLPLVSQSSSYHLTHSTELIFPESQVLLSEDSSLADHEITIILQAPKALQLHLNYQDHQIMLDRSYAHTEVQSFPYLQSLIKTMISGLKENTLYFYEGLPLFIELRANEATLKKIHKEPSGNYTLSISAQS